MGTTVQSLGSLRELDVANWPKMAGGNVFYDRYSYDYQTIYRTQPNVRQVVDFLGRNIAQLGLHLYRRVSDTDRERLADHPLATILQRPNRFTTRYRLIDGTVQDMGIFGNAYWLKLPTGAAQPVSLMRLPPQYMLCEVIDGETIYTLSVGGRFWKFTPENLVHFRNFNPENSVRGISNLETLRQILAEEHAAGKWREGFWQSGAHMSGFIERPADAAWDKDVRDRFLADFKALYTGVDNAGGIPLLEDGMTFKAAAFNSQESEYLLGRKLNLETVVRMFHIPLPMVGILDHATFSNIEEQHRNLYQDCLMPSLEMLQGEIELQLLPDFEDTEGVYLEFNIQAKMAGSFEQQATAFQASVGGPWMTRNEARARMNLSSVDGGDELITPLNVTQGGQASPLDSGKQNRAAIERFVDRQARVLKSNGGKYDAERWQRELSQDLEAVG